MSRGVSTYSGTALNTTIDREGVGSSDVPDFWGDLARLRSTMPARPTVVSQREQRISPGRSVTVPQYQEQEQEQERSQRPMARPMPQGEATFVRARGLTSLHGGAGIHEVGGYEAVPAGTPGAVFSGTGAVGSGPATAPWAPGTGGGGGGGGGGGRASAFGADDYISRETAARQQRPDDGVRADFGGTGTTDVGEQRAILRDRSVGREAARPYYDAQALAQKSAAGPPAPEPARSYGARPRARTRAAG